jgi:hypothetical protein
MDVMVVEMTFIEWGFYVMIWLFIILNWVQHKRIERLEQTMR